MTRTIRLIGNIEGVDIIASIVQSDKVAGLLGEGYAIEATYTALEELRDVIDAWLNETSLICFRLEIQDKKEGV